MGKEYASQLRLNLTDAERILWRRLRVFKSHGFHFRRQAPFENYVLDFVCHRARVVIELDGSQHAEEKQIRHDEKRTKYLTRRGYRVLRVWNSEVFENPDGVAEAVLAFARCPHPHRVGAAPATR
jgi:very-short-patch-repair endonuclease